MIEENGPVSVVKRNALIKKNLALYSSLANGVKTPTTPAQRRFVLVCKGGAAPKTMHEKAYMSYRQNLNEQHQIEVTAKANKTSEPKTKPRKVLGNQIPLNAGTSSSDKHGRIEADLADQRSKFRVRKNVASRKRPTGKAKVKRNASDNFSHRGQTELRLFDDTWVFVDAYSRSYILRNADIRRANPTKAEAELQRLLNSINGGVLRGRFEREHVVSGKWVVDFFFPEVRLAIEVDGSIHDTQGQRAKDRLKDADCERFDITMLRLRNSEIFRDHGRLVEKLRAGWQAAKNRENRIIGKLI
jgi:very-short-patch-repair endonuclease/uncharacterized protein YifE (UPF0438 family)